MTQLVYFGDRNEAAPYLSDRGWEMGGIFTLVTGSPFTVLSGRDNSLSGVGFDRPNVTGSPELSGGRSRDDRMARYFDTSVFTPNLPGQFGNAGKASLRFPGQATWDMGLFKNFSITERQKLQFRFNFYNWLNHPLWSFNGGNLNLSFSNINLQPNNSDFGVTTQKQGHRIIEMGAKYTF